MKRKPYLYLTLGVGTLALSAQAIPVGPYYDSPNGGNPLPTGQILITSGGDVTLTFLGPTTAIYHDIVFIASPPNGLGQIFDNHGAAKGTTYDLGSFAAGTELEFALFVFNTSETWYSGPGSRNADGFVHAYMLNNYEGLANTTYVGFEDLAANAGADWNYVDDIFAVTGANAQVPDGASTFALLGLSLCSVVAYQRRCKA
jgi:hypothetical protein